MAKQSKVGLHVSAAGGVENAPLNAKEFGAECFQFFSRSPRGGGAKPISEEQAALFRERSEAEGYESYIHTPYYINFASKNNKIYYGSIGAVREELARGTQLGVKYVMTHMGSAKDHVSDGSVDVPPSATTQAIEGLKKIYTDDTADFTTQLLLEISAGAGAVLGDSFEELALLLEGVGRDDIGICLDTCHLFASGYDVRTPETIKEMMKLFKQTIGLKRLKLIHMNDSKAGLGEHKDRHEHMGKGNIGAAGIKAILNHPDFIGINFILETEHDEFITADLDFLKKYRP
jgi:deoxyribonuclease-4